jgi:(E)-4-hydroxy-3-methylbut-2-enyl-diphosphate synthase
MDQAADYVYIGSNKLDFETPGTIGIVVDYDLWLTDYQGKSGYYPLSTELITVNQPYFYCPKGEFKASEDNLNHPNAILVIETQFENKTQVLRKVIHDLYSMGINNPFILKYTYPETDEETFQLHSSSDAGSILIDGYGDGIWITAKQALRTINSTSFGILQATRTRISKTEYISCPSCGRTLFDLQETTGKIRQRTSHLKGLKIGIMGCIVNGPGEMADADYGYVGTGPGKINLYKEKTMVRKNIAEAEAVDALIDLIREHGDWTDATN